jgi:hypothetical protein
VHHAVEASRPLCKRLNHELTVTLPSDPVFLDADPARLSQIVGNLLNNACKLTLYRCEHRNRSFWTQRGFSGADPTGEVCDAGVSLNEANVA